MKKFSAPLASIAFLIVGSFFAADSLVAQSTAKTLDQAAAKQEDKSTPDATQVAEDGYATVRAMHAARVAIFNGDPDMAKRILADAKTLLEKTKADELAAGMKDDLIPIDGSLQLSETFEPSPETNSHINKANEHFSKGDKDQALKQLRQGEIEVNFSRVLMPIAATEKQLIEAINLANDGKFYECNLALKAAEDGLKLDTVELVDLPAMEKANESKKAYESKNADQGSDKK